MPFKRREQNAKPAWREGSANPKRIPSRFFCKHKTADNFGELANAKEWLGASLSLTWIVAVLR
jgi:hypothetical protein